MRALSDLLVHTWYTAPAVRRRVALTASYKQSLPPRAAYLAQSAIQRYYASTAPLSRQRNGVYVLASAQTDEPTSAYVHLPFCKRRCFYCDFPVQAIGNDPETAAASAAMQQYVATVVREIHATSAFGARNLETVYFGGGTPSLIPPTLLQQLLAALDGQFGIAPEAEVTMEADPGTFTAQSLCDYMALGVSRFSIGVQAFDEAVLRECGRSHSLADVHTALDDVRAAGAADWSLDLISGLPHASPASWQHSLEQAVAAGPGHVSVYDLQVEEKTKFGRVYTPGQFPLPSDDASAEMYTAASDTLRGAGYEHYEISSFAKPGHRSRHNSAYWSGVPYHAFGLGAASYLGGRRFSRPKSMAAYKAWVAEFERADIGVPGHTQPPEGAEERLLDAVMLRLRLADGLDLSALAADYGAAAAAAVEASLRRHTAAGLVELAPGRAARLTDPAGFLVSNAVISDVFAALDGVALSGGSASTTPVAHAGCAEA